VTGDNSVAAARGQAFRWKHKQLFKASMKLAIYLPAFQVSSCSRTFAFENASQPGKYCSSAVLSISRAENHGSMVN
jgi:hypothetical protein